MTVFETENILEIFCKNKAHSTTAASKTGMRQP
jgi:hypothetical protein